MKSTAFQVRAVSVLDSQNLLDWRNHPDVLRHQLTQRAIHPFEHERWLSERLQPKGHLPFLAYEENGSVIGYVRLDFATNREQVISILISPSFRGQGYGAAILHSFLLHVRSIGNLEPIFAYVHNDNIPSQRLFRSSNFKEDKSERSEMKRFVYP